MRFIIMLLLLFSLTIPASNVYSSGLPERDETRITAIHQKDDGDWLVLESNVSDYSQYDAILHTHTEDWEQREDMYFINVSGQGDRDFYPVDVAPAQNGTGWWILVDRGRVFRFNQEWEYTGTNYSLYSNDNPEYRKTGVAGITEAQGDRWWMLGRASLSLYTNEWNTTNGYYRESYLVDDWETIFTAVHRADGRLWIVRAQDNHRIFSRTISESAGSPTIANEDSFSISELPSGIGRPHGIERSANGDWWIADQDGSIHRFDSNWQYTGEHHNIKVAPGTGNQLPASPLSLVGSLLISVITPVVATICVIAVVGPRVVRYITEN